MRITHVCCKCLRTCKTSLCSSPKGKPWISHNIQLQHNNSYCPFVFCDNWNTGTEQQDNGVVSTRRRISECLQIWVILARYWALNLWRYETFLVVWFSLFLSQLFHPIISDGVKGMRSMLAEKKGLSQDPGEWSDFPQAFSFGVIILTPCHRYTQTQTEDLLLALQMRKMLSRYSRRKPFGLCYRYIH